MPPSSGSWNFPKSFHTNQKTQQKQPIPLRFVPLFLFLSWWVQSGSKVGRSLRYYRESGSSSAPSVQHQTHRRSHQLPRLSIPLMGGQKQLFQYGTAFTATKWLSLDVCGLLGISVSYGIHLFAFIIQFTKVIPNQSYFIQFLFYFAYLPFSILAVLSLYQASTTDPGAVPLGARPFTRVRRSGEPVAPTRALRRCAKCANNYKPDRAHHDSVTGRCIVKFDHFCPWVNNAVGALNHKFFCLFLWYTAATCITSLVLVVMRLWVCGKAPPIPDGSSGSSSASSSKIDIHGGSSDGPMLLRNLDTHGDCIALVKDHRIIALAVASLVFLLFTVIMAIDQWEAISTGQGESRCSIIISLSLTHTVALSF